MIVTASYDDGNTKDVTGYTVTPSGALATTDVMVTISFTEGGVTETATQAITVTLKEYTQGELETMTLEEILAIGDARGYTFTDRTDKNEVITDFLSQQ